MPVISALTDTSSIAAMENVSLPSDVCNNFTTSSSEDSDLKYWYLGEVRYLALEIINIFVGTVGIIDNLFVIIIFACFIKITDKVKHKISSLPYRAYLSIKRRFLLSLHLNLTGAFCSFTASSRDIGLIHRKRRHVTVFL